LPGPGVENGTYLLSLIKVKRIEEVLEVLPRVTLEHVKEERKRVWGSPDPRTGGARQAMEGGQCGCGRCGWR
jgi:hypothetical protein